MSPSLSPCTSVIIITTTLWLCFKLVKHIYSTVEDTDTTLQQLDDQFGNEIAMIVSEVSDDKSKSKVERKKLQIEHAKSASSSAKLIKLADKLYIIFILIISTLVIIIIMLSFMIIINHYLYASGVIEDYY